MSKRLIALLSALLLVIVIGLSACSGSTGNHTATDVQAGGRNADAGAAAGETAGQQPAEEEAAGGMRTYTDHFGEVTIPVQPQRLLVMVSRYAEYLISLGVDPQLATYVRIVEPEYRQELFASHGVEIIDYPQYEHNFELLLELDPDMIITMSAGLEANVYEQLNKIAPTVAISSGPSMDAMPLLAGLFGKEAEYETVMKEFNAKVEQAKVTLDEALGDSTVMVIRVEPKEYRVLGPKHEFGSSKLLYHQLELNIPEALADAAAWFNPVSLETLPEINPDYIFIENRVAEGSDTTESWDQLMDSSLWRGLKAVQAGRVFPLNTSDFVGGEGPVGYSHLIDYIVSSLAPATGR